MGKHNHKESVEVESFVSAGLFDSEKTSRGEDDNLVDRDPPSFIILEPEVPGIDGEKHFPKFDHDDGRWCVDMKRKKRDLAQGVAVTALTAFWHFFLLLITCGATETELTYGYERYPPFALKYGYKGPGKYKHYMKINVDDHYQIHGSDEDRPPDNYTYADGVKYLPGGKVGVARAAKAAKNASNKINPESVEKSVAVPRPKDHDLADPHFVGGMKGNGYKNGRKRPKQALAFFEEVRIIVYVNEEVQKRTKEEMWISNEIILQNKKEHKKEKDKLIKAAKAKLKEEAKSREEGRSELPSSMRGSAEPVPTKLSMAERLRNANVAHSKEMRDKPLSRREVKRSVAREVSHRYANK
eukprot:CAMPEP_0118647066 /NCGR_PEP_ID=MMETSP0785-20121206/8406_1 /TAXON_ID=91992 /ORGANISM="Bolidomonas pacifica, Strain CCMP 1866" /LENGTH=354 /DNA_ID=CAMNT_0006539131 /DNA_START=199 /DNA_END=1264 /DNA_ORIENTATION=+